MLVKISLGPSQATFMALSARWLNRLHGSGVVLLNYFRYCKKYLQENHPSSHGKSPHRIHRDRYDRALQYRRPFLPYLRSLEDRSRYPVRVDHSTNHIRLLVLQKLLRMIPHIVRSKPTEHLLFHHTQTDRSLQHLLRPYVPK